MNSSSESKLVCMLCGLVSNNLVTHITRFHKYEISQYKSEFPGAEVIKLTTAQIAKMRETKRKKDSPAKQFRIHSQKKKEEMISEGKQILRCQICGFESISSLIFHIVGKHKMTTQEYKMKFGDCCLQQASNAEKKRNSLHMKEKMANDIEYREKFIAAAKASLLPNKRDYWIAKGIIDDEEIRQSISEYQKSVSAHSNTPEIKQRFSERFSGDNNPMSLESIMKRKNVDRQTAKQLTPAYGRKKEKHPMWGKKHTEEALAKIAASPSLRNPAYRSKAEIELFEFVSKISPTAVHNGYFKRWNIDILDLKNNIAIEYFGTFWHMHPSMFKHDEKHRVYNNVTAEMMWTHDEKKLTGLKDNGFLVIVIWEHDWINDKEAQLKKVTDAYDRIFQ